MEEAERSIIEITVCSYIHILRSAMLILPLMSRAKLLIILKYQNLISCVVFTIIFIPLLYFEYFPLYFNIDY